MGFLDKVGSFLKREAKDLGDAADGVKGKFDQELTKREDELKMSPSDKIAALQQQAATTDAKLDALADKATGKNAMADAVAEVGDISAEVPLPNVTHIVLPDGRVKSGDDTPARAGGSSDVPLVEAPTPEDLDKFELANTAPEITQQAPATPPTPDEPLVGDPGDLPAPPATDLTPQDLPAPPAADLTPQDLPAPEAAQDLPAPPMPAEPVVDPSVESALSWAQSSTTPAVEAAVEDLPAPPQIANEPIVDNAIEEILAPAEASIDDMPAPAIPEPVLDTPIPPTVDAVEQPVIQDLPPAPVPEPIPEPGLDTPIPPTVDAVEEPVIQDLPPAPIPQPIPEPVLDTPIPAEAVVDIEIADLPAPPSITNEAIVENAIQEVLDPGAASVEPAADTPPEPVSDTPAPAFGKTPAQLKYERARAAANDLLDELRGELKDDGEI